ncbi:hypothetical protein KEM52_000721 [Ascosphaera acerosa]|nr:hypothetical protein KEM52_000721 [Ascosphaera acerosa]
MSDSTNAQDHSAAAPAKADAVRPAGGEEKQEKQQQNDDLNAQGHGAAADEQHGQPQMSKEEADRLYEERIEEEYAKREGEPEKA